MGFLGDIGSGIGQFFGAATGIGGSGTSSIPDYKATGLDPGSQNLIKGEQDRAARGNDQFAGDLTRGVSQAKGGLQSDTSAQQQNAALGGQDNAALRQAIQARAARTYNTNENAVNQKAQSEAPLLKQQATMAAAKDTLQQQQNFNHNVMMQDQAKRQKVMMRNQIIGGLFSGMGSMVGMLAGSGAAAKTASAGYDLQGSLGSTGGNDAGNFAGPDASNFGNIS